PGSAFSSSWPRWRCWPEPGCWPAGCCRSFRPVAWGRPATEVAMARDRRLMVVLAGGAGGRLDLLTEDRAKPAVPFGGAYRLIDFPLSNAHHSGIDDVWVVQQFHPASIEDHLANGRPWDLDRTTGGLLL